MDSTKPSESCVSNSSFKLGTSDTTSKKKKKAAKRLWLPWEFCKLIEPEKGGDLPPFGWDKPSSVTTSEKAIIASESETLFPVGFYDMTPAKRGVTKGRGDWKGKEALRLAHCSAEKNGCRFKARFCRVVNGMEIYTSGTHDIKAHLTPRKRGLAPAARAIVTKYKEESQSKLVEWLKDGGLLDDAGDDLEKVKQQIKRRKMTLKRKQKRVSQVTKGDRESSDESAEEAERASGTEEDDDPLYSAKINMLQDDSIVSLIDPPEHGRLDSPRADHYHSDDEQFHEGVPFVGTNPFGDGPYSPTTVIDEYNPSTEFHNMFEHPPLLHTTDLFPRTSHDYPLSHIQATQKSKSDKLGGSPSQAAGMDPSGYYAQAAEV